MKARRFCVIVLLLAARPAKTEIINLAPLADVYGTAMTDASKGPMNINDEHPVSYWSAWPYTMRGEEDVIRLVMTLPMPFSIHRVEIDSGLKPPELLIFSRVNDDWAPIETPYVWDDSGFRLEFPRPKEMTAIKLEFWGIREHNSGVAMTELRLLGELPRKTRLATALDEGESPTLDWHLLTTGFSVRASSGSAEAAFDGRKDTHWKPKEGPQPWIGASLHPPKPIQRVEFDWTGSDYARRNILELRTSEGETLLVPRMTFSTSYTLPQPIVVDSVRLYCSQTAGGIGMSELRLFSDGTEPTPPKETSIKTWIETPLVKIGPDVARPTEFSQGQTMRIALARNEYEAAQVIVRNEGEGILRGFSIRTSDLQGPSGAVIPAENINCNPVGFVNGLYPDVLLPRESFTIMPGQTRSVWMTVFAPPDQRPGEYQGTLELMLSEKSIKKIPLIVTVWDIQLPEETHVRTHYFTVWGTGRYFRETLEDAERTQRLLANLKSVFLSHRISFGNLFLMGDYERTIEFKTWNEYLATFDRNAQEIIDAGIPFLGALHLPDIRAMQGAPQSEAEFWSAMQEHLREKGWLDRFSVIVGDEPPPGNQRVTDQCRKFIEMAPDLRRQCAFSSFGPKGTASWTGLVNEWGISPRYYGDTRLDDLISFCRERLKAGDGLSWYIHHVLSVEMTPYFSRMYFWYIRKYGIPGALLYGVAEWGCRDVGRWEDDFVIHGLRHNAWGTVLWPGHDEFLPSIRWEMIRDGIEDYELGLLLEGEIDALTKREPNNPLLQKALNILDQTDNVFVALDDQREAEKYPIHDIHGDGPYLCTRADPANLLGARENIAQMILRLREEQAVSADGPAAPQWAVDYTEGLKAWREMIYYWIDRQTAWGTFGFGWGEDCEMIVGWPAVMMAADDKRIQEAIDKLADARWFNGNIQRGYIWKATDPEHGPEPISYTNPVLLYQEFGSPRLIERLMVTAQNVEYWTGMTPRGDRHMRSTYFGSQQIHEWEYYNEDSPINARAWIPMMHLVMYNRDPYLLKHYLEWADSWVKHAADPAWGKPPGFLFGQVVFPTGEPGGYTHNWWGGAAHDFSSLWYRTRLHETLIIAYHVTGDEKYLTPLRTMLDFVSTYAKPQVAKGEPLPPDRFPEGYSLPPGWRDGTKSTQWARDVGWGHPYNWYVYVTGEAPFDDRFRKLFPHAKLERGPYQRIDEDLVRSSRRRAENFRDNYFNKVVPSLKYKGSVANYAAAWWAKRWGTMTFGNRCFHDGGNLANSVNWPWVDFPPPAVVWKDTGYDTGIFVLEDSPQRFHAALCNITDDVRSIGAQFFTLDEGSYQFRIGDDADLDGVFDSVRYEEQHFVERGTVVRFDLPPKVTQLIELERDPQSGRVPTWKPKPDLALDAWDITGSTNEVDLDSYPVGYRVAARVHNIGTQAADNVAVDFYSVTDSGAHLLQQAKLPKVDAPERLIPSYVEVAGLVAPDEEIRGFEVRIDEREGDFDRIDEIYEGNNRAYVSLAEIKSSQPVKEWKEHAPAKKPTIEDIDTEGLARYDVPFRERIELDGVVGDEEWKGAKPFELIAHGNKPLARRTKMRLAYDKENLYVALWCEEPNMDLIDDELTDIHEIYYNDGFEIFLDPGAQVWRYWQFVFDTVPRKFMTKSRNEFAPPISWEVAIHKGDDYWTAEVAFPFEEFDVPAPKPGDRWRMNVMRFTTTIRDPEDPEHHISERSHFSPLGTLHLHHQPEKFGDLYFE